MSQAAQQIQRLLWLIPAAARPEGISLSEAATRLGVSRAQVLDDFEVLTAREFYMRAGSSEGLQIWQGDDGRWRISGPAAATLNRPVRLTLREALCVALGVRGRLSRGDGDLLARLERHLAASQAAALLEGEGPLPIALPDLTPDPAGIRARISLAARERRVCRFGYVKPGAAAPEMRRLWPAVVCEAEGRWYAVGIDPDAQGARSFRIDRMLEDEVTDESFALPDDFDVESVVSGGRVFVRAGGASGAGGSPGDGDSDDSVVAEVRYTPLVAPWVVEHWGGQPGPDGFLTLHHIIHSPEWIERHILGFGGQAELRSPLELRELVARSARRRLGVDVGA